jgi:hypothetical protein
VKRQNRNAEAFLKSRLSVCANYLQEVEAKLVELKTTMTDDPEANARVTEALSFVHDAYKAVSAARTTVESLKNAPVITPKL